jgi:hypothetical protein
LTILDVTIKEEKPFQGLLRVPAFGTGRIRLGDFSTEGLATALRAVL